MNPAVCIPSLASIVDLLKGTRQSDRDIDLAILNATSEQPFLYRWYDPPETVVVTYDIPDTLEARFAAQARTLPNALTSVRNYTSSLDGAVALLDEVLPDWGFRLMSQVPGVAAAEVFCPGRYGETVVCAQGWNAPIALVSATLTAVIVNRLGVRSGREAQPTGHSPGLRLVRGARE